MKTIFFKIITVCTLSCISFNSFAQSPDWLWAKSTVGSGFDKSYDISVDIYGNSYITGYFFSPSISFGAITLFNSDTSGSYTDMFVVKYDPSGNVIWARSSGGNTGHDGGRSICVDSNGNSFVTGSFSSPTITFGSYILTNVGDQDVFIVKYDSSGNVIWANCSGGINSDLGESICVDANGNFFVAGSFRSPEISFGSNTLYNVGLFVVKYDTYGNVLWAKSHVGRICEDNEGCGISIAVDSNDYLYITGSFDSGDIFFGSYALHNAFPGYSDIFIAKYDNNGNVIWAQRHGGILDDYSHGIDVDFNGDIYITGHFSSSEITFENIYLDNYGAFDYFVVKYNPSGNVLWANNFNMVNTAITSFGIKVDGNGNSYIAGRFQNPTLTFGTTTLFNFDNGGTNDIFILKYNLSGNLLWALSVKGTYNDFVTSISLDGSNNPVITGYFYGPIIIFGTDTLTNIGSGPIFTAKLDHTVGIEEFSTIAYNVDIYPNPTIDKITIDNKEISKETFISVFDIQGKQLMYNNFQNQSIIEINVSKLTKGVYLVKIQTDKSIETKKLMIQ